MLDALFLFDNALDRFRAQQVAEKVEGVRAMAGNFGPVSGDQRSLDPAITERIDAAVTAADCVVVLIGQNTAANPRVTYAVTRAVHDFDRPVIGVRIDKLNDENGVQGTAGDDPFVRSGLSARTLLQVETYDPPFATGVFARSWIRFALRDWMELAMREAARRNAARDRRARRTITYG
jgi:hypothetical protein